MFRKIAATLAAVTVVVAMAGCAGATPTPDDNAAPASDGGGLISIIVNDPANPYWTAEGDAAKAEAEKLGYTANVSAHKGDSKLESDLIDTAITNKSVAIIIDPADADGSIGAVQKATDAGIPVFLVNAEINEEGIAKGQLVSNNAQGAALGATEFVKATGGKGIYVELKGKPSDNNAATRSNGYASVLSQYPDLKLVGQEVANWDTKEAHDKTQTLLTAHPEITAIIAGNDTMALGAIAALKEASRTDVIVGGFDGSPDAAAAVADGSMAYTVLQPVTIYATAAVTQADAFLKSGKTGVATEKQTFDCFLINKDNIAKYGSFSINP
ncbi:D-ribose ABC transporter substrate-binding protein [Salinibacterium xinjiangense]|uniref:Monosaccharide ABC transporter substrate-binding protein, CUT2 family n=1 Tax=Salinibacterium xinjiangense TaxID=386302 RepID=A0A2C8Y5W6_9MICO|nr:D-ribose ABC transporter substrate-binding protein [Salinibacterium xinjiangense]GGK94872.1 D-ribose ABC transporter substrate-binding protein [Salinibacterium xinjiangense]SOE45535.1 monosaccharide ABC transporter substrate-binding protein, CUT2 family [Salinibacterium xinjiangense]